MTTTSFGNILGILQQDMLLRLKSMDIVSSNLSNVNTAGYKSSRYNFQELLGGTEKSGSVIASTQLNTDQGSLTESSNSLDLAIIGDGYFAVKLANGQTGYTRDGRFTLDENRQIVNAVGNKLIWSGSVPEGITKVSVEDNGSVTGQSGQTRKVLGSVQLSRFTNPTALQGYGDNIWLESANSGKAQSAAPGTKNLGSIISYNYEKSNVSLSDEMVNLITLQRGMTLSIRTFQTTDTMIQQALQMRK